MKKAFIIIMNMTILIIGVIGNVNLFKLTNMTIKSLFNNNYLIYYLGMLLALFLLFSFIITTVNNKFLISLKYSLLYAFCFMGCLALYNYLQYIIILLLIEWIIFHVVFSLIPFINKNKFDDDY